VNSRYDRESDLEHESDEQDREISLGTTTILGIFFALALLCAVFFGFGYSLGRRSAPPVIAAGDAVSSPEVSGSKPAPGSPLSQAGSNGSVDKPAEDAGQTGAITPDEGSAAAGESDQQVPAPAAVKTVSASPVVRTPPGSKPVLKPVAIVPVAATPAAAPASAGVAVVQVAAVSHQEDADVLAAALKRRGYNVAVRQVPQDKLLHVQIGPFATRKEADAMKQHLQTDGYNAIVK
jgi:DedD protein